MGNRIDIKAEIKTINAIQYTANDSYIPPNNLAYAEVFCIGAGGDAQGLRVIIKYLF